MNSLLKRRSTSHRFLCGLLAVLIAAGPATSVIAEDPPPLSKADQAQANTLLAHRIHKPTPFNIQYAVPRAAVVVAFRPNQFLASPTAEMFPTEIIQAASLNETGIDPVACEQLVVSVAPPMQGPPAYSVYAKFSQPVKLADGKAFRDMERAEVEGKPYFRSKQQNPMEPSFISLDEKSLLAAPDFAFPGLLEKTAVARVNPLTAKLLAADQGDDLLAMIDAATLRPLIFMALGQADLPPEAQPLLQIPNLIKLVEIRVNLSRPGNSELLVTANDEDAAVQLVELFNDAKAQIAAKIRQESQRGLTSEDPVEQAAARYSERMIKLVDQRLQLVREGDHIVLMRGELAGSEAAQTTNVAVIGVLVALLLPAVQTAREAARRNASMNNIKQILLGLLNYEATHKRLPAHANYDDNGKPLLSWRVHILPYIEQQALHDRFHLDEPWDSEHNRELIPLMPDSYLDPSSGKLTPQDGKTHYLGVAGEKGLFDGTDEGRMFSQITDGTSNSIAVVQVNDDRAAVWTKPDDWQPDATDPTKGLAGLHPGGSLAGFCDGHVQFIAASIDPDMLKALLTIDGDEVINDLDP